MSTSISTSFVRQYEDDVKEEFQRIGTYLLKAVRHKSNVKGSSTTFQRVGTGTAVTKSRHGTITPMNQSHTAPEVTLVDFYAGDFVDKLDELKINHDERLVVARGGAMALGRKIDNQIIAILNTTTESTQSWGIGTSAAVRNSLLLMTEALDANDVPNDGFRYGALTPRAWAFAMTVQEFSRSDWVGATGLPFREGAPTDGRFKDWMNVKWFMHTDLPGITTSTANIYVWHKNAVAYASGADITADITWEGTRAAHWVNHWMSGQAGLIESSGVIEGQVDDGGSIPTA